MPQPRGPLKWIAFAVLLLAIGPAPAFSKDKHTGQGPSIVMIIRHGEKPSGAEENKDPNLSERGVERARALAKVIPEHFPKPDVLIAARRSKHSNRSFDTIAPLSKALHETIETTFDDDDYQQLAQELLTRHRYAGKVVLIAWHHGKIPELAKALGAKDAPKKWDSQVFDRVWEITYEDHAATLHDLPQHALPGDSQQ
jgi:phosphohistidine phosphatase SixA